MATHGTSHSKSSAHRRALQGSRALPDEAFEAFEATFCNPLAMPLSSRPVGFKLASCMSWNHCELLITCEQIREVMFSDFGFPTENLFDAPLENTLTLASPSYWYRPATEAILSFAMCHLLDSMAILREKRELP